MAKRKSVSTVSIPGFPNVQLMLAMQPSGPRYSKSLKAIRLAVKRKEMYWDSMN
jgi:hypothetical protein